MPCRIISTALLLFSLLPDATAEELRGQSVTEDVKEQLPPDTQEPSGDYPEVEAEPRRLGDCDAAATDMNMDAAQYKHTCSDVAKDSKCTVECKEGYTGDSKEYTCMTEGFRTGGTTDAEKKALPTCTAEKCDKGIPSGDNLDSSDCTGKKTTETCQIKCVAGYTGTETYTCQATGAFEGTEPVCTKKTCSNDAPSGAMYSNTCDSKKFEETCAVECGEGYQLKAGETAQSYECKAKADGVVFLDGTSPTCESKECQSNEPTGDNITHTCSGKKTGETCNVECAVGYNDVAAETWTCNSNGGFTGTLPTCVLNTTTTTTTAPAEDVAANINGAFIMTLEPGTATDFIADSDVEKAMVKTVAVVASVSADWVNVSLSIEAASRRLSTTSTVKVDYTITVPAGKEDNVKTIQESLAGSTKSDFSSAVDTQMVEVGGASMKAKYSPAVTSVDAPEVDWQGEEPTTTADQSALGDKTSKAAVDGKYSVAMLIAVLTCALLR